METRPQPQNPPIDLPARAYRHLMHTLIALLPPPIEDTPEATLTRNHAAIARIAALAPVNADEAELAAQCIAARAQAEDILRLIRLHASDINLIVKLNAQYTAMIRASLSAHNRLLREQQQRRKRETNHDTAGQDEWTRHIAAEAMLSALPSTPKPSPVEKSETKSHTMESETPKRRFLPDPPAVASVNAIIDAALRSARADWRERGLPRSNNGTGTAPRQRSA
ncbi:MAG TPA: hypothetical protein DDZ81_20405 [Acetobacteraceae bacterium]|jgi:hypothetical protein|nr:hypothetical protein [Acetobacteraceae bacterium]